MYTHMYVSVSKCKTYVRCPPRPEGVSSPRPVVTVECEPAVEVQGTPALLIVKPSL